MLRSWHLRPKAGIEGAELVDGPLRLIGPHQGQVHGPEGSRQPDLARGAKVLQAKELFCIHLSDDEEVLFPQLLRVKPGQVAGVSLRC